MIDIKVLGSSSKGNCYLVDDGSTRLLLECGISYKEIQKGLNFQTSTIDGCLVSHEHGDHTKAAKEVMKASIDIYTAMGTQEFLNLSSHRIKTIQAMKQFTIGTWTILPFETQHDAAEPLGFLLQNQTGEKLLFATDTYYIKYKFSGLTHIMIEANYSIDILNENVATGRVPTSMKKRLLKSHFSLEHVKDFLRANDLSKVKEIWLLHLSDTNSDADMFKREIMELTGKIVHVA
ncbi:MBL fold metallo-hydrolase [Tepidibacillus marianensis]|uniref:MBL fold metallo-hydrolase n=1 Tax=Tepidibacillus marianensis TaxID=3131995 RepID=UPI0030CDA88A